MSITYQMPLLIFFGIYAFLFTISTKEALKHFQPPLQNSKVQSENTSEFYIVNYYYQKNDQRFLLLDADILTIHNLTNRIHFTNPKGIHFTKKNEPVDFSAEFGYLKSDDKFLQLDKNVLIKKDVSTLRANRVEYYTNKEEFQAFEQAQTETVMATSKDILKISANKIISWPYKNLAHYYDHVQGVLKRKLPYEPNLNFQSDTLYADLTISKIELINNVGIQRENISAESLNGEIFLENYNKEVKYYILKNDVKITEKIKNREGKSIERKSYAETLEGYPKFRKIILKGYPKVIQEGDVTKGNQITIYERSEIIEVEDSISDFKLK